MKPLSDILQEIRPEYDFASSNDFIADGMLDSFDVVTLVTSLEKNYSIFIAGTDIVPENFKNLQAIHALLAQHNVSL